MKISTDQHSLSGCIEPIFRNMQDCFASFDKLPQAVTYRRAGFSATISAIPIAFLNGLAFDRIDPGTGKTDVREIIGLLSRHNVPFRWWVSKEVAPSALFDYLEQNGMFVRYEAPAMTLSLAKARKKIELPSGVDIAAVRNMAELEVWSKVLTIGYERNMQDQAHWQAAFSILGLSEDSPWQHTVLFENGIPAAVASIFWHGEVAGLYLVVTLKEFRRKGYGSLLTQYSINLAAETPAKTMILQASEIGVPVYRRLGFTTCCQLKNYEFLPSSFSNEPFPTN